jgi:hypothetical protein
MAVSNGGSRQPEGDMRLTPDQRACICGNYSAWSRAVRPKPTGRLNSERRRWAATLRPGDEVARSPEGGWCVRD